MFHHQDNKYDMAFPLKMHKEKEQLNLPFSTPHYYLCSV